MPIPVLTPAERRAALSIVLLLLLGAAHDAWRARHPRWTPPPARAASLGAGPAPAEVRGPAAPAAGEAAGAARDPAPAAGGPRLDLNRADERTLDALPGVGPVLARRILEQRRQNGPFRRVEDLRAVRGIGPRLFERLRPYVTVSGS